MPVLKPVLVHLQKPHSPSIGNAVFLLSAKPLLFAARNSNPYLRVVMLHSGLTGINLFSCSFSASPSARLGSGSTHSPQHSTALAGCSHCCCTDTQSPYQSTQNLQCLLKEKGPQPYIVELIRKQNFMQNLSVGILPGLPCLDHRCVAALPHLLNNLSSIVRLTP